MRTVTVTMLALLVVALVLIEYLSLSFYPLPYTYGVSRDHPLGLFTASLVFDGWGNLSFLTLATLLMLVSVPLLPNRRRLLLSTSFLIVVNIAGPIANLVYLASPDSAISVRFVGFREVLVEPVALGMSISAYAALAFSIVIGVLVIFRGFPRNSEQGRGKRLVFWRLGISLSVLLVLVSASQVVTAFLPSQVTTYHVIGFLVGLAGALILVWRIDLSPTQGSIWFDEGAPSS